MGDLVTQERTGSKPQRTGGPIGRGRPTRYSEELADAICEDIRTGASLRGAALKQGIAWQTLQEWAFARDDFAYRIACAQGEAETNAAQALYRAGTEDYKGDPKMLVEVLKRQYRASGWGDTLDLRKMDTADLLEMYRAQEESADVTSVGTSGEHLL